MRQEYIETFLEIVKTRNISNAAENLFLSQSATSSRLRALEEEMHVPLFKRGKGNRYVMLTPQGKRFVQIAERWMLLLKDTDSLSTDDIQSIRIGSIDSISSVLLAPLYQRIVEAQLPLKFEIITQQSVAMYDYVSNRDYDMGLVAAKGHRTDVVVEPFFLMEMSIVINCGEEQGRTIDNPGQLDPKQEIYMEFGPEIKAWRRDWWSYVTPQLSIDSFQLLERYLSIPNKWALIPTGILNNIASREKLYRCDFGQQNPPKRICYYIYHKRSGFFDSKKRLLALMTQQIEEDPTLTLL